MAFEVTSEMSATYAADGALIRLSHPSRPFVPTGLRLDASRASEYPDAARRAAEIYLRRLLPSLDLPGDCAQGMRFPLESEMWLPREEPPGLRFLKEVERGNGIEVVFAQTAKGLPVWRSEISIRVGPSRIAVIGARSTACRDIGNVAIPGINAPFAPFRIDQERLRHCLSLDLLPEITGKRLLVYRYDPLDRGNAVWSRMRSRVAGVTISPPAVPEQFSASSHYIVGEISFVYALRGTGPMNWRAFIEPQTGSVLRVDAAGPDQSAICAASAPQSLVERVFQRPLSIQRFAARNWSDAPACPGADFERLDASAPTPVAADHSTI